VRTEFRQAVMAEAGYQWDYDIMASAPTLILQHAQHLGMDLWLEHLQNYISNRTEFRQYIARVGDITEKQAKTLINALFCGARLGANRDYALFHLLDKNHSKVRRLKDDARLTGLRADIKTCWEYIEPSLARIEITSPVTGRTRKLPLSSKRKWVVYFGLERKVLNAVRDYLHLTDNPCFLEHDGWKTKNRVDVKQLVEFVRNTTGFSVQVEEKNIGVSLPLSNSYLSVLQVPSRGEER
jgi:hypothetical protein